MSTVVNAIREEVSNTCQVKRCQKEGCKVRLPAELHPFVLIDMDQPESPASSSGKRCDFLFVNESWLVPLELKKGKAAAGEIVRQLRAGTKAAESVVAKDVPVGFRPVAAYGGTLRKQELNDLKKSTNKIRFREDREFVRLIKCGASLTPAFLTNGR